MPKSRVRKNKKNRVQRVLSAPRKVFKEIYLTVKGVRLMLSHGLTVDTRQEIHRLYSRNRYTINPDAKVIKVITHQ
jgi:hypothetical protein